MMCAPIDDFLFETGMHPDGIDLKAQTDCLENEMRLSLKGRSSALRMYPSYVVLPEAAPVDGCAIALDAGGTHFRVAVVRFRKGSPEIIYRAAYPMPGTAGAISKSEFLSQCAQYIEPVLDRSDRIGYGFSYPAQILPNHDGRLRLFQKEVKVEGSEGMEVCAQLESELKRRGAPGKRQYILLNDTVAALVGGYVCHAQESFDGALALVYGTGTNTCYCETDELSGEIVNMESSSYTLFPKGHFDIVLDSTSAEPGDNLYEKMVASTYMGGLITLAAREACARGLFSSGFSEALSLEGTLTARQADAFVRSGAGSFAQLCHTEADAQRLRALTELLYERAAKLGCAVLTAAMEKCGAGERGPACIAAEGTGFWGSILYAPKLLRRMEAFTLGNRKRNFKFVRTEDANLIGAAATALLN